MKRKLLFILSCLLSCQVMAQQNFEGVVLYSDDAEEDGKGFLQVFYGKEMIKRISWTETAAGVKTFDRRSEIIDLKKGIVYRLNNKTKKVDCDTLSIHPDGLGMALVKTDSAVMIAGHSALRYHTPPTPGDSNSMRFDMSIWFGDDIRYVIPTKYRGSAGMISTETGNILILGLTIQMTFPDSLLKKFATADPGDMEEFNKDSRTKLMKAITVTAMDLQDSEFAIPAGYSLVLPRKPITKQVTKKPAKPVKKSSKH